ncbi:MAG: hypothetical protein ACXVBR_18010 [Flavisolibacter sp.]
MAKNNVVFEVRMQGSRVRIGVLRSNPQFAIFCETMARVECTLAEIHLNNLSLKASPTTTSQPIIALKNYFGTRGWEILG